MHTLSGTNGPSAATSNGAFTDDRSAPSLANVTRVLFRHKWKAIGFFAVTVGLTLVAVVFCPRKYVSQAKLLVRVGRETATLDPTATTGHIVNVQTSRERDMNSVREILQSQSIVERVVDAIGVDVILNKGQEPSLADTVLDHLRVAELDPITDREAAILLVTEQIQISGGEASDSCCFHP